MWLASLFIFIIWLTLGNNAVLFSKARKSKDCWQRLMWGVKTTKDMKLAEVTAFNAEIEMLILLVPCAEMK